MRRVEDIERAVRELGPSIAKSLVPIIQDLQAKQAQLEEQQDALEALFNSSVTFLADFNDNNSLVITTAETQQCIYSFTVPAGYSRALVVGYGSVGVVNPTATASSIGGRIYIDRPSSTPVWGPLRFQQALAGADAAAYPYKQTVITGLSGGETVTLRLVAINSGGVDWGATPGGASLNVQAYFSRT